MLLHDEIVTGASVTPCLKITNSGVKISVVLILLVLYHQTPAVVFGGVV